MTSLNIDADFLLTGILLRAMCVCVSSLVWYWFQHDSPLNETYRISVVYHISNENVCGKFFNFLLTDSVAIFNVSEPISYFMMTSSNVNIFGVTGHLCAESTGHRWIPFTKASDTDLRCFFLSTFEQTNKTLVIWDTIVLIMTPL